MAKGSGGRRRFSSRQPRPSPYSLPSCDRGISEDLYPKKCSKALAKKDWEDATCSVCLECPHNAVLLLCSSHDKGCRPYMCGTSFRYSNCLDQYKNACTKVISSNQGQPLHSSVDSLIDAPDTIWHVEKCEVTELACPLCRGQVKGWTVVEPAREYLNAKKRICMQDDCSFVGTFKELRKHMKAEHLSARPREVDPTLEQKWRRLEREGERDDVISTIRSTMPGAMVLGDYVIEGNRYGFDSDEEDGGVDADAAERIGGFESERTYQHTSDENAVGIHHSTPVGGLESFEHEDDSDSNYDIGDDGGISLVSRLRRTGRDLFGRSSRRHSRREASRS